MKYKIIVQNSQNKEFECSAEQDLLCHAIRSHIPIQAACRSGGCGVCKIKVLQGQFERGKCSKKALPDVERSENYSFACKTYPRSDMVITIEPKKNTYLPFYLDRF